MGIGVKARRGMLCVHEARRHYTEQGTNRQVLYVTFHVSRVDKTERGEVRMLRDLATGAARDFGGMDRVYLDSEGKLDRIKVEALFAGMPSAEFDTIEEARTMLRACEVSK